jgi:tRNA modification GTPase
MLLDPIVALATPPGRGALALVRLAGVGAFEVAAQVLTPFAVMPARTARRAHVIRAPRGEVIDEALYLTYPGPASYTGQDTVEITTHGGLLVPADVLAAVERAGARMATPGEFTRRAVLNGKLDLLQAEAVGDLIDATAPAQRRAALHQLDRGLSHQIAGLREDILALEALLGYDIDFPDEDDGPVAADRIDAATVAVQERLASLLATAAEGMRLRAGALVVIAGQPNVGKSSLFNALLGTERAIVTAVPGTTRDAVEAPAVCDGFPFRLVDTAGLRETAEPVERLGVEVSRRYLAGADLVLFCAEAGRGLTTEEEAFLASCSAPVVVVRTKTDLTDAPGPPDHLHVSAERGVGLDAVRSALAQRAFTGLADAGEVMAAVTRERHRTALTAAARDVDAFAAARRTGVDAVVAAVHLRAAAEAVTALVGPLTPDDVLDRVFATFCIGK